MSSFMEVDVLVIGGGAAGVSAAVAASKEGAKVLLIEKNSFLGGKATASAVGTVCGIFLRCKNEIPKFSCSGFTVDFIEQLATGSKSKPYSYKEGLHFLPYDPTAFQILCDQLICTNNIPLLFDAVCISTKVASSRISTIDVFTRNKRITIKPKAIVDCSGEALLHQLSGGKIIPSTTFQTASHVFSLEGVKEDNEQRLALMILRSLERAVSKSLLPADYDRLSIVHGSLKKGKALFKLSIPKEVLPDSKTITELEIFARKAIAEITFYLTKNVEAFAMAHIGFIAPEIGIRTGTRPEGKYILKEEDVMECRKFANGIANGTWPIEFWGSDKKPLMKYFKEDDFYQIPAEALISGDFLNLFFAGRNISASDEAIASARVIGTCLQTGWASGKLAAYNAFKKDYKEAIKLIRKDLTVE